MNPMQRNVHNGFVLSYSGPIFAASRSNQITYECFCLMGGLENGRLQKVERGGRYTYHRCDIR